MPKRTLSFDHLIDVLVFLNIEQILAISVCNRKINRALQYTPLYRYLVYSDRSITKPILQCDRSVRIATLFPQNQGLHSFLPICNHPPNNMKCSPCFTCGICGCFSKHPTLLTVPETPPPSNIVAFSADLLLWYPLCSKAEIFICSPVFLNFLHNMRSLLSEHLCMLSFPRPQDYGCFSTPLHVARHLLCFFQYLSSCPSIVVENAPHPLLESLVKSPFFTRSAYFRVKLSSSPSITAALLSWVLFESPELPGRALIIDCVDPYEEFPGRFFMFFLSRLEDFFVFARRPVTYAVYFINIHNLHYIWDWIHLRYKPPHYRINDINEMMWTEVDFACYTLAYCRRPMYGPFPAVCYPDYALKFHEACFKKRVKITFLNL